MRLHTECHGSGPPLVILHGLLGSGRNWRRLAKSALAERYTIHLVDLPNHGHSPREALASPSELIDPVVTLLQDECSAPVTLLGHSLGGQIAMQVALQQASLVSRLLVVDIAPRRYAPTHAWILDALAELDLSSARYRRDIDRALSAKISEPTLRNFLLTNVTRNPAGEYSWSLGIDALQAAYPHFMAFDWSVGRYPGPTLFVSGAESDYIQADDRGMIRALFPRSEVAVVPNAGHWVHYENPRAFIDELERFLP